MKGLTANLIKRRDDPEFVRTGLKALHDLAFSGSNLMLGLFGEGAPDRHWIEFGVSGLEAVHDDLPGYPCPNWSLLLSNLLRNLPPADDAQNP